MYSLTRRLPYLSENQAQTMKNAGKYSGNSYAAQQHKLLNRRAQHSPPRMPEIRPKNWFAATEQRYPSQLKKSIVMETEEQYPLDTCRTSRPLDLQFDGITMRMARTDEDRTVTGHSSRHPDMGGRSDYMSGRGEYRGRRNDHVGGRNEYWSERSDHDGFVRDCYQQYEDRVLKPPGKLPPIQDKKVSKKRRAKKAAQQEKSTLTLPSLTNVDMPPYQYWQP